MTTENSKVIDEISVSDLVRKCFCAYELKDRRIIEEKIDDKWVIAHEHQSVPFDSETGKASLNLKP